MRSAWRGFRATRSFPRKGWKLAATGNSSGLLWKVRSPPSVPWSRLPNRPLSPSHGQRHDQGAPATRGAGRPPASNFGRVGRDSDFFPSTQQGRQSRPVKHGSFREQWRTACVHFPHRRPNFHRLRTSQRTRKDTAGAEARQQASGDEMGFVIETTPFL